MKKITIVLFLNLCLLWQAFGQENIEKTPVRNYFYMSPFGLFASHLKVAYERDMGAKRNSIALMGGLILRKMGNEFRKGGTAELNYRINLYDTENGKTRHRVYWGPFAKYVYMEVDYTSTDNNNCIKWDTSWSGPYCAQYGEITKTDFVRSGSGGMIMGWRVTHAEIISFDIYLGGGAQFSKNSGRERYDNVFQPGYTGILPVAGFQLGMSF